MPSSPQVKIVNDFDLVNDRSSLSRAFTYLRVDEDITYDLLSMSSGKTYTVFQRARVVKWLPGRWVMQRKNIETLFAVIDKLGVHSPDDCPTLPNTSNLQGSNEGQTDEEESGRPPARDYAPVITSNDNIRPCTSIHVYDVLASQLLPDISDLDGRQLRARVIGILMLVESQRLIRAEDIDICCGGEAGVMHSGPVVDDLAQGLILIVLAKVEDTDQAVGAGREEG